MDGAGKNAFGDALRQTRRKRNLSLRSLVARAGISYATLSYWEAGKSRPRLPELECVLHTLGVSHRERRTLLDLLEPTRALYDPRLAKSGFAPSVGSDLLWSMRLRRGWMQTDVARVVGVHQAQIARWERGESWPDAEKLHRLCWHLGATPEELAALTTGKPTGVYSDAIAAMPDAWNAEGATGASLDLELGNDYLRRLLFDVEAHEARKPFGALLDLTLLTVENRLNLRARHDAVAATLLPVAYGVHSRLHLNDQQFPQAAFYAERGFACARRLRDAGNVQFAALDHSFWFGIVIALGDAAAKTNVRARHQYAVKTLEQWLPLLGQSGVTHKAWGLSTLATLLHKLGRNDEALAVSQQSCRPELSPAPQYGDYVYRHLAQADLLMQMGHPRQAIDTLERCREMDCFVGPGLQSQRRQLQEQYLSAMQQN